MRGRYTASARTDIDNILTRIGKDNPAAKTAVGAAIKVAITRLCSFPYLGAVTDQSGIYMKIARPYHYQIFYRIASDTLVIRSVRHPARRRPPNEKEF